MNQPFIALTSVECIRRILCVNAHLAARRYLTVRNLPADLARALERERSRSGASLNQTVIDLLRRALGLSEAERSNGLAELAGSWSARDLAEFEAAVFEFERIDQELWQ